MKKLVAMLLAVAGTLGLWADTVPHMSGGNFQDEHFVVGSEFVTGHDETNGVSDTSFWFTKDTDDFEGTIASDDEGATKYLDFESNITNPVYRTIFNSKGDQYTDPSAFGTNSIGLGLFIDTQVKFTPYTVTDVHTAPEGNAGDKLIVWLREKEVEVSAGVTNMVTNLVATASYFKDDQNTREVKHYELNYSGSYAALVNSFNRLTIKALVMKEDGESVFVGFVVYLNENVLTYNDNAGIDGSVMTTLSGTAAKYYNSERHALLPSLAAPLAANAAIAAVGFSGTGAVKQNYFDNYDTDYPDFAADNVNFEVKWSEGVASFSCLGNDIVTGGTAGSTNLTVAPNVKTFEITSVTYATGFSGAANTWYDQKNNKINNTTTGATVTLNGSAWYMIDAFQDNFDVGGTKFKYLMPTAWDSNGGAYNYVKQNGGTLKLLNDAESAGDVLVFTDPSKVVIIDLAGKTLGGGDDVSTTILNNGGTIVITNSTVEIGTLATADEYALAVGSGDTKIYGGNIGTVFVNDDPEEGTFGADDVFEIYGGTFTENIDPALYTGFDPAIAKYIATGYTYRGNDADGYTVYPAREVSITVDDNTIESATFTLNGESIGVVTTTNLTNLVDGDYITAVVSAKSPNVYEGDTNWTVSATLSEIAVACGELPKFDLTIPSFENMTVSVTDGTTIWTAAGTYKVQVNKKVDVTWTAAENYLFTEGKTNVVEESFTMTEAKELVAPAVQHAEAKKGTVIYLTLKEALEADGTDTVELLANAYLPTVTITKGITLAVSDYQLTITNGVVFTVNAPGETVTVTRGTGGILNQGTIAVQAGTLDMSAFGWGSGLIAGETGKAKLAVADGATIKFAAGTSPLDMAAIDNTFFAGTAAGAQFYAGTAKYVFGTAWAAMPWAGTGAEGTPYQIATYDDLVALKDYVAAGLNTAGVYFEQTATIDFAGKAAWAGIGVAKKDPRFCGTYDGKGFKILNVTLDGNVEYAALFGQIGAGADVKNISELNIAGVGNYKNDTCVGGLIGYAEGAVTVSDVKVTGTIGTTAQPMKDNVSGLICRADTDGAAVFTRLEFAGSIYAESASANRKVAGILGYAANQSGKTGTVKLDSCVFSGALTNNATVDFYNAAGPQGGVGGLMGYLWSGCGTVTVKDCVVTGTVTGNANVALGTGVFAASLGATTVTQGTNKIAKTSFAGLKLNGNGNSWPESYGVEDATDSSLIDLCGATFTAGKTYYTVKTGLTPTYTFTEAGTISFNTNLYAAASFDITAATGLTVNDPIEVGGVVTYTAEAQQFTVTYKTDAETTKSSEQVAYGNSPASIPDMTDAKEHYTFAGWDSNPTGAVITADTTYTAQWESITYTITTAGGSNADVTLDPADGKGVYGATVSITAAPKSGYTYDGVTLGTGWGLNNDGYATNTVTIADDAEIAVPNAVAEAPTGFTITIVSTGLTNPQYKIGEGEWTSYTEPFLAADASVVYARATTSTTGYYVPEVSGTVSGAALELTVTAATIMSKYFPTIAGEEEGTEALPFKIENYNDLVTLQAAVTNGALTAGVYFEQVADIDFDGKGAWAGIGVAKKDPRFCGTYDGKGFKILNVTLDGNVEYAALFGQIGAGADVKNISELNIAGVGNYKDDACVGGLIGYTKGAVTVSDIKVTGTIGTTAQPMKDNVSGLICRADTDGAAVFTRLEFAGTIYAESASANRKVAGILGYSANQSGKTGTVLLDSCVFSGAVTNNASVDFYHKDGPQGGVGGLMGYLWSGCGTVTVKDCVVTGTVTGNANVALGTGVFAAALGATTVTQGTNKIAKTSFAGLKLNGNGNSWPESYAIENAEDSSLLDLCGATFTAGKTYYTVKSGLTPTYTFTEAGTISFNTNLYAATAFSVTGGEDFDVAETAAGGVVTFTATAKPVGPTPTEPVDLPKGTSQADAEKAAAAATPVIPEGAAKTAGQDNVVKCVAVYNSTKECYQIEVAIDTNKLTKTVQETVVKVADSLPALAAAEPGTVTVPVATEVTPGLYYSLGVATELGSSATFTEGTRVLATGSSISLTVTKPAGTKAFFKVFVNLTAE